MEKINNNTDYKSLPDYIEVRESIGKGKGLFTLKNLEKGDVVSASHYECHPDDKQYFHQGLIRTHLGAMINHDSNCNCRLIQKERTYYLQVLNPTIIKGTELTIDYARYNCGSTYFCIKKIYEVTDEMKRFEPMFRMSDDHTRYNEQIALEAKISKMIFALSDVEKHELIQELEKAESQNMIKHFNI